MSNKLVTELTTMQIKSRFTKDLWHIYLGMLGLEERDAIQHKAYAFVKWVIQKNAKVCLAFLVSPMFYLKLKKLLLESYNCYKDNSESKFTDASFEVFFNGHFTICELLLGNCIPYDGFNLKVTDYNEVVEEKMKFDLIVTNPPYAGKGDPLFMKISKVIYDNCLAFHGKLVSINPTSIVDNTYDTVSAEYKEKYENMKVLDFVYRPELRTAFEAGIGTGICITTFSKDGKHDLWSDYVREKRFGKKNWDMRKAIIGKVKPFLTFIENEPSTGLLDSYKDLFWIIDSNTNSRGEKVKEKQKEIGNSKNLVILAFNRGHVANVGEHLWDWTTLQSEEYLTVKHEMKNICQFVIPFDSKADAIAMLKWLNTDFIMFIVNHYKTQMSNSNILFRLLPCPPALDGNYSDEVLMKHFNLTQEEMDWIHSEMKDFGWKVNLKKTESELMVHIDEINK